MQPVKYYRVIPSNATASTYYAAYGKLEALSYATNQYSKCDNLALICDEIERDEIPPNAMIHSAYLDRHDAVNVIDW